MIVFCVSTSFYRFRGESKLSFANRTAEVSCFSRLVMNMGSKIATSVNMFVATSNTHATELLVKATFHDLNAAPSGQQAVDMPSLGGLACFYEGGGWVFRPFRETQALNIDNRCVGIFPIVVREASLEDTRERIGVSRTGDINMIIMDSSDIGSLSELISTIEDIAITMDDQHRKPLLVLLVDLYNPPRIESFGITAFPRLHSLKNMFVRVVHDVSDQTLPDMLIAALLNINSVRREMMTLQETGVIVPKTTESGQHQASDLMKELTATLKPAGQSMGVVSHSSSSQDSEDEDDLSLSGTIGELSSLGDSSTSSSRAPGPQVPPPSTGLAYSEDQTPSAHKHGKAALDIDDDDFELSGTMDDLDAIVISAPAIIRASSVAPGQALEYSPAPERMAAQIQSEKIPKAATVPTVPTSLLLFTDEHLRQVRYRLEDGLSLSEDMFAMAAVDATGCVRASALSRGADAKSLDALSNALRKVDLMEFMQILEDPNEEGIGHFKMGDWEIQLFSVQQRLLVAAFCYKTTEGVLIAAKAIAAGIRESLELVSY